MPGRKLKFFLLKSVYKHGKMMYDVPTTSQGGWRRSKEPDMNATVNPATVRAAQDRARLAAQAAAALPTRLAYSSVTGDAPRPAPKRFVEGPLDCGVYGCKHCDPLA